MSVSQDKLRRIGRCVEQLFPNAVRPGRNGDTQSLDDVVIRLLTESHRLVAMRVRIEKGFDDSETLDELDPVFRKAVSIFGITFSRRIGKIVAGTRKTGHLRMGIRNESAKDKT